MHTPKAQDGNDHAVFFLEIFSDTDQVHDENFLSEKYSRLLSLEARCHPSSIFTAYKRLLLTC